MGTFKHLSVWASCTHQIFIANEPIVNKSKRGADLLVKYPLPLLDKLLWSQTGEPKPWGRSCKNPVEKCLTAKISKKSLIENGFSEEDVKEVAQIIIQTKKMRIYSLCNPKPRTNPGGTLSKKHPTDRLVRPTHKFAKLVTKTSSKVREPKSHSKVINDCIHRNRWREVVDDELWNLDIHQTWCYTPLSDNQKAIGCK